MTSIGSATPTDEHATAVLSYRYIIHSSGRRAALGNNTTLDSMDDRRSDVCHNS